MHKSLKAVFVLSFCAAGISCAPANTVSTIAPASANAALDVLAESYFQELLPQNPVLATSIGDNRYNDRYVTGFSAQERAKIKALEEKYFAMLKGINRNSLDDDHRITFDVLNTSLASALRDYQFPSHLLPLNQMFNFTASFVQLGAGTGLHPFKTVKDYEDFLSRINGFTQAVDTAIGNMRQGIALGITQNRVLMERVLPQLSAHIVNDPSASLFYGPVKNMPAGFTAEDRQRLTAAYENAIRNQLVPAFRRLHTFVKEEYIPAARTSVGYGALPNGTAWYAQRARASTTTTLTPEEIHSIGLAEVARIHAEMDKVKVQVGFQGTLQEFFKHLTEDPKYRFSSREEMLSEYRAAKVRIDAATDKVFDFRPKADYEIRAVEPFRERSFAIGAYQAASPDGSRPGIFYLNTYEPTLQTKFGMADLLLHEGSPGHHFQISVQRELTNVPKIRRFGGFSAYSEGWGLYAESLGPDMAVFADPYQYYGMLAGELWRAIRLVIDTGIHSRGWTREQGIEYGKSNSSRAVNVESEVERFMAIPGQALAYKIGQLKIIELRRRAEKELGSRFDIKMFHRAVLQAGALPLDVLETRINSWIAQQKS